MAGSPKLSDYSMTEKRVHSHCGIIPGMFSGEIKR